MAETTTRRGFLAESAAMAGALALGRNAAGAEPPARRPNVIFAFSDEHRWQSMSFTEMPALQTPNMARMAREGVAFSRCVSNYPVCSPYRAMLLTGLWPAHNGMIDNGLTLDPALPSLGRAFRDAGYRTAYVGKWHLGGTRAEAFGFDTSLVWTGDNTHWDKAEYHPADGKPVRPRGYNATLMTDQALDVINAKDDRPFFLMLSWNPPHSNFLDPPKEKLALYPEGSLPWRENIPEAVRAGTGDGEGSSWSRASWPYYQGYHAHISAIDDELGRLMAALEARGLDKDTLLVYSADHGSMMGSHGLGGKRMPHDESVRVPLIARWPGRIPAGAAVDALAGTVDLAPTLRALAGLPAEARCDGADLSPWFLGGKGPDREAQLIMHMCKKGASGGENHPAPLFRGLRTRRHTYAVRDGVPWLLFDNREDPFQQANRADDPALASLHRELHTLLADALRAAGDDYALA